MAEDGRQKTLGSAYGLRQFALVVIRDQGRGDVVVIIIVFRRRLKFDAEKTKQKDSILQYTLFPY